jgi:hypothetical protein
MGLGKLVPSTLLCSQQTLAVVSYSFEQMLLISGNACHACQGVAAWKMWRYQAIFLCLDGHFE